MFQKFCKRKMRVVACAFATGRTPTGSEVTSAQGFRRQCIRNFISDCMRASARDRLDLDEAIERFVDEQRRVDRRLEAKAQLETISRGLSKDDDELLKLRALGFEYREIAAELEITEDAARQRMRRLRQFLARRR